jgi:hypothetical protein
MAIDSINGAASPIAGAIRDAARTTGTSFEYLLTTAQLESNLNPAAQAATSSAKGLYQFIDQTWLATMKQAGPALGLGSYANAIVQAPDGSYAVPDAGARAAIMKLRSDPSVSATLAGAFTRSNAAKLAASIGRTPSEGELYIAHFLGSDGAGRLITAAASTPQANAAAMFPAAAAANRSIFYDRTGHPLGVGAVYSKLTGRYEVARALAFARRGPAQSPVPVPPALIPNVPVADTAGVTQAYAEARMLPASSSTQTNRPAQDSKPLFQAMFTDLPRHGVSQAVNSLWAPAKDAPQTTGQPSGLLNLFRDIDPGLRKPGGGKA